MGEKCRDVYGDKRLCCVAATIASVVYFAFYVVITGLFVYPQGAELVVWKNVTRIKRFAYEEYSWEMSLVLFGILSVVFVVGRFRRAIREGSKNSLELWESYPISRTKRMKEEIRNILSLPVLVTLITVMGSMVLEAVRNYLSAKSFTASEIEVVLIEPCFFVTMLLSALYGMILMMIALFVEIIMTNRLISFLTGGIMFLAANIRGWSREVIPVPAVIFREGSSYFEISHLAPFPTAVYALFCIGIILLLCMICMRVYEKRELSADGLFYFSALKDIFLVLIAILVLTAGGFFGSFDSHLNQSRVYVWVAIEVSALLLFLNYLSESPDRRRHWKRLAMSSGRIILLFTVATCGVITVMANETIGNTFDQLFLSKQSEIQYEDDTGYEDLSDKVVLSTQLDRADTFQELATKMPDVLCPDSNSVWEEWKLKLFYENRNGQRVYTGYSLGCRTPVSERISCIFERCYDMEEIPNLWVSDPGKLVFKHSERFGTVFCEKEDEWNLVSVYKYNEHLKCYDSYRIWSMDSIDEIIAFIDDHLQPVKP